MLNITKKRGIFFTILTPQLQYNYNYEMEVRTQSFY